MDFMDVDIWDFGEHRIFKMKDNKWEVYYEEW